jgi:hypothetical protein
MDRPISALHPLTSGPLGLGTARPRGRLAGRMDHGSQLDSDLLSRNFIRKTNSI